MVASHHLYYYSKKTFLLASSFLKTFFFTFLFAAVTSHYSHAAALAFNYQTFSNIGNTLNLTGDVSLDNNNGALNLTDYDKNSLGRVTYYKLLHLWDNKTGKATEFTTHFTFSINTPNKTHHGDGITFYLAQQNFPLTAPRFGGSIGLLSPKQYKNSSYITDEHPFVAVEFDTNYNQEWDPCSGLEDHDHVGIDINGMATSLTKEWYTTKDERVYDVNITYHATSNNLTVFFTGYKDNITNKQQLSAVVDLRQKLPEWVEFGFTSSTGWYYEYHTLFSWSFNSTLDFEAHKERKTAMTKGLTISAGVLLTSVLGIACLMGWKLVMRRNNVELAMDRDFERNTGPRRFSYQELSRATSNFAKGQKIGEGGFGGVYRGFLRDLDIHVAIKKISQGSRQGVREYASEVKIISKLRHKNLVQLIGWCHEQNDLLLVYEFMENGSLDSYIFKGKGLLPWEVRYNVVRGLASALLYLHEEWEQCVLHRDIKPNNIMLDSNFNARLGDFGLARLMDHEASSKTTTLAGTFGYLAPEAATRGKTSKESDVYSFGIVALEIACGRRVIERNLREDQFFLVDWVWELYSTGDILKAADPRLEGAFDEQEMERVMIVGLWCAHMDYLERPSIRQAIQMLCFEVPVPTLPSQPNATFNFNQHVLHTLQQYSF
ncbi:hypothetical protein PIB30_005529 [Stylosanthes scabra]|uniref:non-specific serine/threonine protein kinase n=1 Tax=Stylosanthes scabra TaxID=79078 RepID=A0ABU6Q3X9_9FABA|nr:hypothetical protein [Stylosanthes scabra]